MKPIRGDGDSTEPPTDGRLKAILKKKKTRLSLKSFFVQKNVVLSDRACSSDILL